MGWPFFIMTTFSFGSVLVLVRECFFPHWIPLKNKKKQTWPTIIFLQSHAFCLVWQYCCISNSKRNTICCFCFVFGQGYFAEQACAVCFRSHGGPTHNSDCVPHRPLTIDSLVHFRCNPTLGPHQSSHSPLHPTAASKPTFQGTGSDWKVLILARTIWLWFVLWLSGWELYCFRGSIWFLMMDLMRSVWREGWEEGGRSEERNTENNSETERQSDVLEGRV